MTPIHDEAYWRNKGYIDGTEGRWEPPSDQKFSGAYRAGHDAGKRAKGQ